MLTPQSPLTDYLARIREKFGPNNNTYLEISDDQYGGLYKYTGFDSDKILLVGFTELTRLCNFLNKD